MNHVLDAVRINFPEEEFEEFESDCLFAAKKHFPDRCSFAADVFGEDFDEVVIALDEELSQMVLLAHFQERQQICHHWI